MSFNSYNYPNRTFCAVLEEMRASYDTYNFSNIKSLIEELQTYGNRMEAGLYDKKDLEKLQDEKSKARKELKKLESKIKTLKAKKVK